MSTRGRSCVEWRPRTRARMEGKSGVRGSNGVGPEPEVANLVPVGFELERVLSEVFTSVRMAASWGGCGGPHALPSTRARAPTCRPDIGTRSQRPPGEETGILCGGARSCGVPRTTRGPCLAPALPRTHDVRFRTI
jgi:hypothetical protein